MIQHGSIEVITDDGRNYGFPINDLHPLGDGAVRINQVKSRTGVQLGTRIDLSNNPDELQRLGSSHVESWEGNLSGGEHVTVRIYRTSEGA